jgi:hypothetical protein
MQKAFYNVKTSETSVEDFTVEETKDAEAEAAVQLELNKKAQAKELEKSETFLAAQTKLLALGLTTEDLKALLG